MAPVDCAWLRMDHPANLMVIYGVCDRCLRGESPESGGGLRHGPPDA